MSYCAAYETEGAIIATFPQEKAGASGRKLAARLVDVELWETTNDGWRIHDWLKYNPTREQAKALANARRAAGKRGGESKASGLHTV
jgi:hypothetical protein